jgi:protein-disulfide isomerase
MPLLRFVVLFALTIAALPASAADVKTPALATVMADRVLGNPKAPVTIIENASFTCSHCAEFHTRVLPEVKKQLIDTGKAKLIFRDFPLDGTALKASALARCMPAERYFPFIKVLYEQQAAWAMQPDPMPALIRYASLAGLAPAVATACMSDTKILDALAQQRLTSQEKYKINATPTFILNDGADRISGAVPAEQFIAKVNALLAKKTQPNATPAPIATPVVNPAVKP